MQKNNQCPITNVSDMQCHAFAPQETLVDLMRKYSREASKHYMKVSGAQLL